VDLKLRQKADGATADPDGSSDGILESRTDMTNGVEQSATAAAAKRLAMSRAGAVDTAKGTNLADGTSDGILESRTDMTNGVERSATAAAAKRLAISRAGAVDTAKGTNLATPAKGGDAGLLDSKPKVPAPYDPATEKDTRPWRCQRCNTLQRPTSTVCVSCTKQRARNVANALSRKVGDP